MELNLIEDKLLEKAKEEGLELSLERINRLKQKAIFIQKIIKNEAKNFKGTLEISLVKCKKCNEEFDYEKTPESCMGGTKCPHCSETLTDDDIDFIKTIVASEEDLESGVITKKKDGWYVLSEKTGKSLGGPYKTRKEALARLKQIEFYKNK